LEPTADDLRPSQHVLDRIAEISPVALAVFDRAERRPIYANRGVSSLLGYSLTDLRRMGGALIETLLHPDDLDRCVAMRSQLAAANDDEAPTIELRVRHADGGWRWLMTRAAALTRDAAGVPCQIVCAAIDISERKRAELELRDIRERHALATSAARVGVWDIDLVANAMRIDPPAALLLDCDATEYRGHADWASRIHPADRERALAHERAIFDPATPRDADGNTAGPEIEYRVVDRRGATRWVADRATVVRDGDGEPRRIVGTLIDISERKRVEEELRALTGQLLRAQDDERRRIARELHDGTAQDLAAIGVDLLRLDRLAPDLPSDARAALEEAQAIARRALTDLRVLAYLLHPPLLDQVGLPAAIRWYAAGFAARSGITVATDDVAEIGRLPRDVETALYRVVQESLANVQRHSGGDCAAVRLARQGEALLLEIRDCGRGLPAGAANAQRPSGVGIASMRERLQRLGGRLEIRSRASGVTVTATLPSAALRQEGGEG
jgi:PAS domain S-box-containing protein